MGYFSRLAAALRADGAWPTAEPAAPLEPRRPVNWDAIFAAAQQLAPRAVQLSAGDAPTWAVPSGANPGHGYIVTGPAAPSGDVDAYACTCPWGRPQGPDERPGVGCKHAVAVMLRRLPGQAQRAA